MAIAIAGMYLIVGIITARFLEKRRMRAATVLHTVLFLLIAFLLLIIPENGWATDGLRSILGERGYAALREAVIAPMHATELPLSAALCAEVGCFAMFLFSVCAAVMDLAEEIPAGPKAERVAETVENGYRTVTNRRAVWLELCRIRS